MERRGWGREWEGEDERGRFVFWQYTTLTARIHETRRVYSMKCLSVPRENAKSSKLVKQDLLVLKPCWTQVCTDSLDM